MTAFSTKEFVNPYVVIEKTDEPDCRFVADWLIKAAEAQDLWREALSDPEFSNKILLIHCAAMPDLAAFALDILGELQRSRFVVALGLYSDEGCLLNIELTLLVWLGFFVCEQLSYRMVVPDTITLARVKQAALDLLSTAEDQGDGIEVIVSERLLHTLNRTEAEAWRSRLLAMRDSSNHPYASQH
jgi:hypothetical protein